MNAPHPAPLRVGLLGFGYAGRTFHAPLIAATPGLALVAVSSRQPEAVHAAHGPGVQVHAEPQALIARDDLDLVVIATPNDTHAPLARAALLAGRAVVVDKPFALDTAEAASLVALAETRGQLLSVFHNRRWDADFLTVRQLLASERLGRLLRAELHFDRFRPVVRPRWREAAGPAGGLWIDLAPHLLDQALQLWGPPLALQAEIATLREGGPNNDWFEARLRWAGGLRVSLGASMLAAQPGARWVLQGSRGGYTKHGLDTQEDAMKAGAVPGASADWGADPQAGTLRWAPDPAQPEALQTQAWPTTPGDYRAYYAGVRDALRGQGANPVPAREALAVMRLLDLGRQSAAEGRELPVHMA